MTLNQSTQTIFERILIDLEKPRSLHVLLHLLMPGNMKTVIRLLSVFYNQLLVCQKDLQTVDICSQPFEMQ